MKSQWRFLAVVIPAVLLLPTGCDDSKTPLSDPKVSKADQHLVGVWRQRQEDGDAFYHVSPAGEKFADSVMRVEVKTAGKGKEEPPEKYLIFPTVLKDKTYLNVVTNPAQIKVLGEKGWTADAVNCYTFFQYKLDGDKLVLWFIDEKAKERAIKAGKIKGSIKPQTAAMFTDTAENVARFVAEAGDSLFDQENPGRFERMEAAKKP
ncbi:MAG: hypothetical protein ABSG68_05270 [Thermoguttaceae bacterium]|jgi:hypothetical protein